MKNVTITDNKISVDTTPVVETTTREYSKEQVINEITNLEVQKEQVITQAQEQKAVINKQLRLFRDILTEAEAQGVKTAEELREEDAKTPNVEAEI